MAQRCIKLLNHVSIPLRIDFQYYHCQYEHEGCYVSIPLRIDFQLPYKRAGGQEARVSIPLRIDFQSLFVYHTRKDIPVYQFL